MSDVEYQDLSSMFHWYPKIINLDIPQPKTHMYQFSEDEFVSIQREIIPDSIIEKVKEMADNMGYPLFLRTDKSSCKHSWERTCYVRNKEELGTHILELLTMSMMQGWMSYVDRGIFVREFLDLKTGFKAFHGDFPVNKERRYFIMDGVVQCHHAYWWPDAIEGNTREDNWRVIVDSLNEESPKEVELLVKYAEMVAEVMDGYWSVDFAMGEDGTWYLIDMAEGEKSFHWLDCEHCPEQMRKQYSRK